MYSYAIIRLFIPIRYLLQILVNGSPASFVLTDALGHLDPPAPESTASGISSPNCFYGGAAMDTQYRAALEISRRGELEILVPANADPLAQTGNSPADLPRRCRSDIYSRYKKLLHVFEALTSQELSADGRSAC
jgi:hypothetical protein